MRVAHLPGVVDQHGGQLAIVEELAAIAGRAPRSQVNFIGRDRLLEPIGHLAAADPGLVVPAVMPQIVHDRCRFWAQLGEVAIRVGLLFDMSPTVAERILVCVAMPHSRNEAGPDSIVDAMQETLAVLPVIGVADDRNFAGVRGPDGKARAGLAFEDVGMSAHDRIHQAVHPVTHGVPVCVGERS